MHLFPRVLVPGKGAREVAHGQHNGVQGERIGERRMQRGDIGLGRVGQRIHAGVRDERRRHGRRRAGSTMAMSGVMLKSASGYLTPF